MSVKLNYRFDEDEKRALKKRLYVLLLTYELKEAEIILFNELDELGLRSEFYLEVVEDVLKDL